MDLKALNKLYGEAVDAIAEHRIIDAISLAEAIQKDCPSISDEAVFSQLHSRYEDLVGAFIADGFNAKKEQALSEIYDELISHLHKVKARWQMDHKATSYGRMAAKLSDITEKDLTDQLRRTTLCKLEDPAYEEALDAAFSIAWGCDIQVTDSLEKQLEQTDNFVKRVLVGGLLLGVLDNYSIEKIRLLISLDVQAGKSLTNASLVDDEDQRQTMESEATDLIARANVALILIVQHYSVFIAHSQELCDALRELFHSPLTKDSAPDILNAFVCQSMTDRAGKRVDDIMSIIKQVVGDLQPRLGSNASNDADGEQHGDGVNIKVSKLDKKAGKKLFREMVNYAEDVDFMRQNDMDVNHINFTNLKRFEFFKHPAHWFYPFDLNEPTIQRGLHHPSGKLDVMTLNIMDHSRFCDSDRYSYASMMAFLRREKGKSMSDKLMEGLGEGEDEAEQPLDPEESAEYRLNPYVNFCQTCYRFFHSQIMGDDYAFVFAPTDDILLPLLPLFEGVFTEFSEVEESINSYLQMGDFDHSIVLLDYIMERYGTTAKALELKGVALMQLRQWRGAISCFQQEHLIQENPGARLAVARCYEAMQEWESALPLLVEADQRNESKDADLIEEIARCLVQLRRWDEAAQRFFQLEFMGEHLSVCQRGIGWCSLHQGKYERAEQYYQKLIDGSRHAQWEDYINLGHALWLQGRTSEAVEAYRHFATTFNRSKKAQRQSFRHWSEAFREDARNLLAAHFSERDIAIMQDAITLK
ncbi:MAG: tetratricopeptide repeat protein [Bacteroidaceae bacterium]|nr:tetratricopeptide repeat protein [Bacteroidaceae bacterium]